MELISALFSIKEKTAISGNVPQTADEIKDELQSLEDTRVLEILSAIKFAIDMGRGGKEGYYIFDIDFDKQAVFSTFFGKDIIKATEAYEEIEWDSIGKQRNAVLVSGSSVEALRKAYPNYFADVTAFIRKTKQLLV